ncbi:MAG TPA: hypothetical protein VHG90_10515 [Acidimicrobiales bacterium]|nr:hypothetical protein [Acidimicrobiales bacterium]
MAARITSRDRAATSAAAKTVRVWEDDPLATGAVPIERPVPKLPTGRMRVTIDVAAPPARPYEPGTLEFRYWVAAEALKRAVSFWSPLLPSRTTWQQGNTLPVRLDAGDRLNALYNRASLVFFHSTVEGVTIFTGESPDVVSHEVGHAVLDAVRPQLWDAMSHEVAAFHESFGDISAVLTALQLPTVRQRFVAETTGRYRASRVSRVAEQLGWGVRQRQPCSVEPDCLRNAVNCFAYQPPDQLPLRGPASTLSSAPHSFSRVFTGAFFEAFAGMVVTLSLQPTADHVLEASVDAGRLLIAAVQAAPIAPAYYAQVAGHLLDADRTLFAGKYANALRFGLLSRGVLSPPSAGGVAEPAAAAAAVPSAPRRRASQRGEELPVVAVPAHELGLGDRPLLVRAPTESGRLALAAATNVDGAPARAPSAESAARAFLAELVMRDRIRRPDETPVDIAEPHVRLRTHEVVEEGGDLVVVRRLFERAGTLPAGA